MRNDAFSSELVQMMPELKRWAFSLARRHDVADDLVQEALARALRYRDHFIPGSNLKAWVRVIVRNEFFSRLRSLRRETALDETTDVRAVAPEQQERLHLHEVRLAMLSLSPEKRQALLIVGVAGMRYDDAAELLDCPVGTLKSRVSRARQELQDHQEAGAFPRNDSKPHLAASAIIRAAEIAASGAAPLGMRAAA